MSIVFVPYEPDHLLQIALQPAQAHHRGAVVLDKYREALAIPGMAWTGIVDREVVGCAGLVPEWEGRVVAWALFGRMPKFSWPAIIRKIHFEFEHSLAAHGRHRVEITVPTHFGPGCRLARLLGFDIEGKMRCYGIDGHDHFLFSKIIEARPCAS